MPITAEATISTDSFSAAGLVPSVERLDHLARHRNDEAAWFAEVEANLLDFQAALSDHTRSIVEDDLYHDAMWRAPRIVIQVRRLGAECFKLDELSALSLASVHTPARSAATVAETLVQIVHLADRHESRALDIDYEAYCVDLGGQG
jgi:hypothetical protein